jgi:hypothetical protein
VALAHLCYARLHDAYVVQVAALKHKIAANPALQMSMLVDGNGRLLDKGAQTTLTAGGAIQGAAAAAIARGVPGTGPELRVRTAQCKPAMPMLWGRTNYLLIQLVWLPARSQFAV